MPIMNTAPPYLLFAVAFASGTVYAQDAGHARLTREDVARQVLEARAAGALSHAGEAAPEEMTSYRAQIEAEPTLTRAQARAAVARARDAHELAHAGSTSPEEDMAYDQAHPSFSIRSRAQTRQQVFEAIASGTLGPGGAGAYPDVPSVHRRSTDALQRATDREVSSRGQ